MRIIADALRIDLEEEGFESQDEKDEYRIRLITNSLEAFVSRFASEHTNSEAECRVVEFSVAVEILKRYQLRYEKDIMRAKLARAQLLNRRGNPRISG